MNVRCSDFGLGCLIRAFESFWRWQWWLSIDGQHSSFGAAADGLGLGLEFF